MLTVTERSGRSANCPGPWPRPLGGFDVPQPTRPCPADDGHGPCGLPVLAQGLCQKHYQRTMYRFCVVDGCFNIQQNNIGLCTRHSSSDICRGCCRQVEKGVTARKHIWCDDCNPRLARSRVTYLRNDVFERDLWICQLCLDPIDSTLVYPDELSASLDHIVPLALGGPDTRANVQAAHLVCNKRKGYRR